MLAGKPRVLLPVLGVPEQGLLLARAGVRGRRLGLRQSRVELDVHRERGARLDGRAASARARGGTRLVPEHHRRLVDGEHALQHAAVGAVQRGYRDVHRTEVVPRRGYRSVAVAFGGRRLVVRAHFGVLRSLVEERDVQHVRRALQRRGREVPPGRAEGERERLLPARGRPSSQPRALRGTLERNLHVHGELRGLRGLGRRGPVPARVPAAVAAGAPPAPAGRPARRAAGEVERLLHVEHELAAVRVRLRHRGASPQGPQPAHGLEPLEDPSEVEGDVRQRRVLHDVVRVHRPLARARAGFARALSLAHVQLHLG